MAFTGMLTAVICLAAGFILVLIEAIIPGFGLPGIAGIALLTAGGAMLGAVKGAAAAAVTMCVLLAVLAACAVLLLRAASKGRLDRSRLFLKASDPAGDGASPGDALSPGSRGVAKSALRPAGIGEFDGRRVSVVTEGGFIEAGAPIEVLRTEGRKTVVRAAPGGEA